MKLTARHRSLFICIALCYCFCKRDTISTFSSKYCAKTSIYDKFLTDFFLCKRENEPFKWPKPTNEINFVRFNWVFFIIESSSLLPSLTLFIYSDLSVMKNCTFYCGWLWFKIDHKFTKNYPTNCFRPFTLPFYFLLCNALKMQFKEVNKRFYKQEMARI